VYACFDSHIEANPSTAPALAHLPPWVSSTGSHPAGWPAWSGWFAVAR